MRKILDFKDLNLTEIRDELGLFIYEYGNADLKLIKSINKTIEDLKNVKIYIDD